MSLLRPSRGWAQGSGFPHWGGGAASGRLGALIDRGFPMRRSLSPLARLALTLGLVLLVAAGTVLLPGRA